MRKTSAIFFQVIIVLLGIGVLAFMLWEPHLEGRNVGATNFEIYFKDPFLAYAYLSSILFFVALYQAYRTLGYVRQNNTFSQATAKALRTIKYCMSILIALIAGGVGFIVVTMRGKDDIAGGVAMGLFMIIISITAATAAAVVEKRLSK